MTSSATRSAGDDPEELDDVDEVRFYRSRHAPPAQAAAAATTAELECTVNIVFSSSPPSVHRGDNGVYPNTVPELNMSLGTAQTAFRGRGIRKAHVKRMG